MREKQLAASLYAGGGARGGDRFGALVDAIRECDERFCRLLLCLTGPDVLDDRIEKKP